MKAVGRNLIIQKVEENITKSNGHFIELNNKSYHVIKDKDVVVVL